MISIPGWSSVGDYDDDDDDDEVYEDDEDSGVDYHVDERGVDDDNEDHEHDFKLIRIAMMIRMNTMKIIMVYPISKNDNAGLLLVSWPRSCWRVKAGRRGTG